MFLVGCGCLVYRALKKGAPNDKNFKFFFFQDDMFVSLPQF
jgi:hypothetical protein